MIRSVASRSVAVVTGWVRKSSKSTAGPAQTCMVLRGNNRRRLLYGANTSCGPHCAAGITGAPVISAIRAAPVFAVIGHSIAEGQDPYNLENFDRQWCEVIKWDEGSKVSFWGRLADLLKKRFNVPIMIYNTGIGGTTSIHWGNSAWGLPFESAIFDWKQRYPYKFFENRVLNDFPKTGLRGIFILHGENDIDISENNIVEGTKLYVQKTRDLLNKPDLVFWMARSNRGTNDIKEIKVRAAQKRILEEIPNLLVGADLQSLIAPAYRHDGTHFNFLGVENAAIKWNEALIDAHFIQTKPLQRFK
jgi:hypothetical protein